LKNPQIEEEQNNLPPLIITTLNTLDKRYISASKQSARDSNYQKILYDESINISQLYLNEDERLFYNGYINESCFFLACKHSFQNGWSVSKSNARQDLNGTDFMLYNHRKKYELDVTISSNSYARRLVNKKVLSLILPIYSPKDAKTYTQLFLENPTEEDYKKYLEHLIFHNRRILNNEFPRRFDVQRVKKKSEKPLTTARCNGSLQYHIKIQETKYRKLKEILYIIEQSTP
jgi:hypothetical protein